MKRFLSLAGIIAIYLVVASSICHAAVLLGHWKLEETAVGQTAVDSSNNGLVGQYQGNSQANVLGTPGFGLGAYFPGGATDSVRIDSPTSLGNLTDNMTVEAWIYPERSGRQRVLSGSAWGFGIDSGDRMLFTTYGVKDYTGTAGAINLNAWNHVVAVLDDQYDATFYVNGNLAGSTSHNAPGNTASSAYHIGGHTSHEKFQGRIDEVAVYSGTLSQNEIQQHMAQGIDRLQATAFHYAYESTETLPAIPDDSGNGNSATARAGAAYSTNIPHATPGTNLYPVDGGDRSLDTSADGATANYANLPTLANIEPAGGFTLETWLYRTADTNAPGLEKVLDLGGAAHISIDPDYDPTGDQDILKFRSHSATATLPVGEWHHYAVVFDTLGNSIDVNPSDPNDYALNGSFRIFFDGQQLGADASASLDDYYDGWIQVQAIGIGSHPASGGERFQGLLYNTRLTMGALAAGEFLLQVPEPSSGLLALLGIIGLAGVGRCNRRRESA